MNWLSQYAQLCGAMSPLGQLVLLGDLGIALAYFALPIGLIIVWRQKLHDLPYPWMLGLFAAFIISCGMTHVVHALQMPYTTFAHTSIEAAIKLVTALLSIGTAVSLLTLLPRIFKIVSPRVRHQELSRLVNERTKQADELVREINHQLGNQLQIMGSAIRIEKRKTKDGSAIAPLSRIEAVLEDLVARYRQGHKLDEDTTRSDHDTHQPPLSAKNAR